MRETIPRPIRWRVANQDVSGTIAEYGRIKEGFFRRFLELSNGIPSADTFDRVFAKVAPGGGIHRSVRSVDGGSVRGNRPGAHRFQRQVRSGGQAAQTPGLTLVTA